MFKKHFSFLLFFVVFFGYSQQKVQLSNFSEISIITSGPGDVLYEKFGHTSIRIKDSMLQFDAIYNYGIFDFDDPNFYLNFTKGFMKYKLVRYPFHYALQSANKDKRWMKEQVLNLTQQEKNAFFYFLERNVMPKNASYLYDPFFNNCATKPRDIINTILGDKILWNSNFTSNKSLRELMNIEINQNTWGSLGINVALGSKLDKKATLQEYLYLPDYVFKALEASKIKRTNTTVPLVSKTTTLLNFKEKVSKSEVISPFLVFFILLCFGGFITYKDYKNKKRTKWLDFTLFFITGIVGVVIIFLWFFTNHSTAPKNFNLLWGFVPNIIILFFLLKDKQPKWIQTYLRVLLILLALIPIIWIAKIQVFNWTLLPLLVLLAIRYFVLQKGLLSFKK